MGDKPVKLIDVNEDVVSGAAGTFSSLTSPEERIQIIDRANGLNLSEEQKRFIDVYVWNGFDEGKAWQFVFDEEQNKTQAQCRKEAKRLLGMVRVRDYLNFLRDQVLSAIGITDQAEFYMSKIVDDLYNSLESDIYDYLDFDESGEFVGMKSPELLTKTQRQQVRKVRITTKTNPKNETKQTTIDLELYDKQKNREQLMKHLKMFTKRGFGEKTSDKIKKLMENAEEAVLTDVVTGEKI